MSEIHPAIEKLINSWVAWAAVPCTCGLGLACSDMEDHWLRKCERGVAWMHLELQRTKERLPQ